jgi:hypothetical protein
MSKTQMDGRITIIGGLWLCDDVAILHVKIDNLNDPLVGFCFIRSIDISGIHIMRVNFFMFSYYTLPLITWDSSQLLIIKNVRY